MNVQNAARIVTAVKVLSDAAKAEGAAAREELLAHMRSTGTERVRVSDEHGENLGAVSLASGRLTPRITDESAFVAWVAQRHPGEVEEVLVVSPGWRERLLAAMARLGDPVDPETGEVVPGVELVRGEPYLTVRPTDEARQRMRGLVVNAGLVALGSGDAEA